MEQASSASLPNSNYSQYGRPQWNRGGKAPQQKMFYSKRSLIESECIGIICLLFLLWVWKRWILSERYLHGILRRSPCNPLSGCTVLGSGGWGIRYPACPALSQTGTCSRKKPCVKSCTQQTPHENSSHPKFRIPGVTEVSHCCSSPVFCFHLLCQHNSNMPFPTTGCATSQPELTTNSYSQ